MPVAPKILAVASAIDLDFRYGCTPAWWQIWKGLYESGVDLVVTPYRGRPVESPWGRVVPGASKRTRQAQGRSLPPPGGGRSRGQRLRQAHAGDDPARDHAALE